VEDLLHDVAAVMRAFTETVELRVSQLPWPPSHVPQPGPDRQQPQLRHAEAVGDRRYV